jgi:hypothetical protein
MQRKDMQDMLSLTYKPFMLAVILLSGVAPIWNIILGKRKSEAVLLETWDGIH